MFDHAKPVDLMYFMNELSEIKRRIEEVQEKIIKAEQTGTLPAHMQAVIDMSGLEIYMTNFANDMRERFT